MTDDAITTEPLHLEPEVFDELVSEVMDNLPQEWGPILDSIAVVVEEEPTVSDLEASESDYDEDEEDEDDFDEDDEDEFDEDEEDEDDLDEDEEDDIDVEDEILEEPIVTNSTLLARFRRGSGGINMLGGLVGQAAVAPPEIALFQGPLERASTNLDDLRDLVRETLIREIGHVFGIGQTDEEEEEYDESEAEGEE